MVRPSRDARATSARTASGIGWATRVGGGGRGDGGGAEGGAACVGGGAGGDCWSLSMNFPTRFPSSEPSALEIVQSRISLSGKLDVVALPKVAYGAEVRVDSPPDDAPVDAVDADKDLLPRTALVAEHVRHREPLSAG